MGLVMGKNVIVPFAIDETDTLAGTSAELIAPMDGWVESIDVTVQKAVGTGGTVKAAVDTTDVAGATVTVADSAAKGTRYSANATEGSSTRKVSKGDRIQVIPAAAFATAGAVSGFVTINSGN